MRITLLAKRNSIHTVRWANSLADRGHEIHLISMHKGGEKLHKNVSFHPLNIPAPFGYYLNVIQLKSKLAQIRPDLLHVHYASGYGTLSRLASFHPLILSIWGSDVYEFSKRSPIHKVILNKNILFSDKVCSTSHAMGEHLKKITPGLKEVLVIPFGINLKKFKPDGRIRRRTDPIVIGTIKTLAPTYGVDILIRAFAKVKEYSTDLAVPLRLPR